LIGNEERSYRKKVAGVDWCEEERQRCVEFVSEGEKMMKKK